MEGDQLDRTEDRGCRKEAGHGEFPSRYWVSVDWTPIKTLSNVAPAGQGVQGEGGEGAAGHLPRRPRPP